MLVSLSVPNLTTGVSQQPPSMRLVGAADQMNNAWLSLVTGLNKRPPTEHVAQFASSVGTSVIGHIIDRDEANRYIVTIGDGTLRVFDMAGAEQTVTFPQGKAYLTIGDPIDTYRFLTIQDTTFILNRNVTVLRNEYGETGSITFSPTGTVATEASLPTANVAHLNQVYFITLTSTYKQCELVSGVAEADSWVYTGTLQYSTPTDGVPIVTALPNPAVPVGSYVWYTYWDGREYVWQKYHSEITTAASSPVYAWVDVTPAEIVDHVGSRLNPAFMGTVAVANSVSNSNYSIYINNVLVANYLSPTGTDASTAVPGTAQIAASLCTALTTSGVANTRIGSSISITGMGRSDTLTVTGTQGDKALKCYRDSIGSFSDLPPNDVEGRIVRVKGSAKDNGDDYYVIYNKGLWVETYGYAQAGGLQNSTMPHKLVKNSDGTFTFQEHSWLERKAGDKTSNPVPSFVDDKIADIFLFTNRMGFISSTNVILSESNVFEDYYRTTLATLIDSDRLDFSVLSAMNDNVRHAIPFNKDILIMADRSQHRFTYNNFVGPKNSQVQFTTAFNCAPNVRPVNMGSSIYFVDDKTGYTYGKMYEYFPKPNLTGDDADETTAPVPEYVTTGMRFIAGSPRVNCVVIGTDGAPDTLYVYKYFWAQEKKVQSAWSKWTFPNTTKIMWAQFTRNFLYLLIQRPSGVYLEKIRIDEDLYDPVNGSRVMLDRYYSAPTMSYSSGTGLTTITLPYANSGSVDVQVVANGVWFLATKVDSTHYTVVGDIHTQTVKIGIPYEFLFQLSTPYVSWSRYPKGTGEVISMDGRLQLRHVNLEYHNTPYMKYKITANARPEFVRTIDQPVTSGVLRIPLLCKHTDMALKITNEGPFNCSFGVAEWYAIYSPKSKRIP